MINRKKERQNALALGSVSIALILIGLLIVLAGCASTSIEEVLDQAQACEAENREAEKQYEICMSAIGPVQCDVLFETKDCQPLWDQWNRREDARLAKEKEDAIHRACNNAGGIIYCTQRIGRYDNCQCVNKEAVMRAISEIYR